MRKITHFLLIIAKLFSFLALALVIVYGVAVYKNWEDVAPSADYQALVKIVEKREEVPEAENAFFSFGTTNPDDSSPEPRLDAFPSVPNCKVKACEYSGELAKYFKTFAISAELLSRYDELLAIQSYQRPMHYVHQDQVPSYLNTFNAQNWYLLMLFQEDDATVVSEKLAQDYAFWKRMLAQSDNWIHTLISKSRLEQNLYIGQQLRQTFSTLSMPNNWRVPFMIDDFNFTHVIATENYSLVKNYDNRKSILVDFGYFRNSIFKGLGYLGYPLYDEQAIKNEIAGASLTVIDFYKDAPLNKLKNMPQTKSSPNWLSFDNIAGKAVFYYNLQGKSLFLPHDYLKELLALEDYRQEVMREFEQ